MGLRRYLFAAQINGVVAGSIGVPFFSLLSKYGILRLWSLTNIEETRYLSVISDNYTDWTIVGYYCMSIGGNMENTSQLPLGAIGALCRMALGRWVMTKVSSFPYGIGCSKPHWLPHYWPCTRSIYICKKPDLSRLARFFLWLVDLVHLTFSTCL